MQAARLSYATDTRFIAIFLEAVAGKSPLKQRSSPWPTPAEQSRSARMTCGGIVSVRPSTCTNVTSTVLSLTTPELPRSTQTIPLLRKPARKPMASGGDCIRVDFATEIEPMTLRASSLGSVTRIEVARQSETREGSCVISAFGTKLPVRDVRWTVAFDGKAEVARTSHFGSV
jgi:hypothetical protein